MAATATEDYANFICRTLRSHGYEAYQVGGCVRDKLLGRPAKDFDVATSALPEQIVELFRGGAGLVGSHFGVVLVREAGSGIQVEVATFRTDGPYSDGRRPDQVQLGASAKADALRRDFTINALFYEPETGRLLDFAGGRQDLQDRLIRAIGDPEARFAEDHLRMLRAIRFAAELEFLIEPGTFAAIRRLAPRIREVAAERVRIELERALPAGGGKLLRESGLASALGLHRTGRLEQLPPHVSHIAICWAALLLDQPGGEFLESLKVPNRDREWASKLAGNVARTGFADLAEHKRLAREPWYGLLRELTGRDLGTFEVEELWPKPLVTGHDLEAHLGLPPGPLYKRILMEVETAQLNGEITTKSQALARIKRDWPDGRIG